MSSAVGGPTFDGPGWLPVTLTVASQARALVRASANRSAGHGKSWLVGGWGMAGRRRSRQPGTRSQRTKVAHVRTYSPKPGDVVRSWHLIDAEGVVLGRLASQIAILLRGKHKAAFAPHVDVGDFVVVVNADKVALSGDKRVNKLDHRHSGFPGGLTSTSYGRLLETKPRRVVEKAVAGMLPHNRLGRQLIRKLKVYAGPEHPHVAQQPTLFEIGQVAQPATTGRHSSAMTLGAHASPEYARGLARD